MRGFCGANRSEYTLIDTFTTPEAIVENVLECGLDSENNSISNKEPIPALIPGDKFTANGWVLYIRNVVETGGVYNGAAYAKIPYLQHSMVEFTLEKAKINTDSVMFAGRAIMIGLNVQLINPEIVERIEYLLNVAELGIEEAQVVIEELQAIVDLIPDLGGGAHGSDTSGFPAMSSKELFSQGIEDLTAAKDTLLDGLKNVIVARDLAQSGVHALASAVEKALAGLLLGQELAPLDSCVVFIANPEGDQGFDKYRYIGSEMQYDVRRTYDEQDYYVAHKAILPNVENKVKVILPGSTISEDLIFKTDADVVIEYTPLGETDENGNAVIELTLNSSINQILAYDSIAFKGGQNGNDTTFWMCNGELAVNSYLQKTRTVVLVPLNGADKVSGTSISGFKEEMATTLSNIYAPANVDITVLMGDKLIVNELVDGMDDSDNNILTRFTKDMNLVIDAFEAAKDPEDDTYYMFLVKNNDTITTKDGYMPFQQRYGFITVGKDVSKEDFIHTTAHELGHGAFNLRHPFSERARYPLEEGVTDNLMDYNEGTKLFAYQWDLVDDPSFMLTWFISEDEVALFWDESIDVYEHIEKFRSGYINKENVKFISTTRKTYNAENITLGDGITYEYIAFRSENIAGSVDFTPQEIIDEKNYDNGRTELLLYKPCPQSSCVDYSFIVNTSQLESFKEYIFFEGSEIEYTNQIDTLLKQYLKYKTSKLTHLLNNLPDYSYNDICAVNVLKSLTKLASEAMNDGGPNGVSEERIAIKLINACDESSEFISKLKYDKYKYTLHNLDVSFNDLEYIKPDHNYLDFVISIIEHIRKTNVEKQEIIDEKITLEIDENTRVYRIKDPRILQRHDFVDMASNGKMNLFLYHSGCVNSRGTYFNQDFDDWVILYFEEDFEPLGIVAGEIKALPAYLIRYLVTQEYNEDFKTGLSIAIDVGSMLFAVGELKAGVSLVRQVFAWADIAASLTNLPLTVFDDEIKKLPNGESFLHSYNIVSGVIALTDISSAGIDALTKIEKLSGSEINKVGEFYNKNYKELNDINPEFAEGVRNISRLATRTIPESYKPLVTSFENAGGIVKADADDWIFITQQGDELARIVNRGDGPILELTDEAFVESGQIINNISVVAKADCGDDLIDPALVIVDGKFGFIENVTSYGSAKIQQTIKQRGKLKVALGYDLKAGQEAHHIIPVNLLKNNEVVQKAVEAGFDFNGKINGLPLDKYNKSTDAGRHANHPSYDEQIGQALLNFEKAYPSYTPVEAKQFLEILVNGNPSYKGLRKTLEETSGRINLLDLEIPF